MRHPMRTRIPPYKQNHEEPTSQRGQSQSPIPNLACKVWFWLCLPVGNVQNCLGWEETDKQEIDIDRDG